MDRGATTATVRGQAGALLRIAVPVAVASLSQVAMGLTDTVLLGGLGGDALAAGGLGASLFFTTGVILQGLLVAAGVLVAQARGAGADERVAGLWGTALLAGLLLSLPAVLACSLAGRVLLLLGEPPPLARDVGRYLHVLRWGAPAFLAGLGVLRAVLPAIGQSGLLLWVTPLMAVLNGLLNYALIHGRGGLPALGLEGSALATALTLWASALVLFALLYASRARRRLVAPPRLEARALGPMLRLGLPISATTAVEVVLFLLAGVAAGRFGTEGLAAHQIVLSIATFTFMVPLALGQAANVCTGLAVGAGDRRGARRAGLVALGLAALAMGSIAAVLLLAPGAVTGAFLDPTRPASADTLRLARRLLGIMALFQVVDGVQAVAIGALRGIGDGTVPMILAAVGYWLVGLPLGWLLAFRLGLGVPGLWMALAAALATVAAMMTLRFLATTSPRRARA